jgi:hypothetical protein
METLATREQKRGINKIFIVGIVAGLAVIALGIWLLSFRPSRDDQMAQILAGSYTEGPEYDALQKDIIISTDDNTVESPTGMGTISMFIHGKIRNKGDKTIDILEVNVGVVTQFREFLKQKRILVVPVQRAELGPGETIPITLTLDGFSRNDDRADIRWKVTAIHAKN